MTSPTYTSAGRAKFEEMQTVLLYLHFWHLLSFEEGQKKDMQQRVFASSHLPNY